MLNKEPHHKAYGMPAAGDQSAEDGLLRRLRIRVKGLRVEALCESNCLGFLDRDVTELVNLSGDVVLEVAMYQLSGEGLSAHEVPWIIKTPAQV